MSLVIMIRASQRQRTKTRDQCGARDTLSVCLSVGLSLIVTRWKWWKIIDINWQRQIFFFAVEWSCYRVRRIETECLRKSNFHSDFNGAALLSIGICFDFTRIRRQMLGGCCSCCSSWPNTKVLWCC